MYPCRLWSCEWKCCSQMGKVGHFGEWRRRRPGWSVYIIHPGSLFRVELFPPSSLTRLGTDLCWYFFLKSSHVLLGAPPCQLWEPQKPALEEQQSRRLLCKSKQQLPPEARWISPFQTNISFPIYDGPKVEDSCSTTSMASLKCYALELPSGLMFLFYVTKQQLFQLCSWMNSHCKRQKILNKFQKLLRASASGVTLD